ncbi:segregation and condensation protein A [Caproiciproducens faecalis]|uniref:Segregation and condensation protein A n=1 Tax=Caproiciproducens faecalis TaxID=2820301 RepID=A0ABS7DRQ2_9FIRM|nr:segregation/condensation protein A [Caproiciproducens faecalis]MBW7573987.1 segregation/condensation protein A [Caproiciproducens faecalis]
MEKLSYRFPVFEGPLDLLLYLIAKNKLNICEIPIAELLDQYTEHIQAMKEQDMDIASDFLEMAARLVYMKTVYLLPKHEEADELRRELSGQLLEYQECKRVAQILAEHFSFNAFIREPAEIQVDPTYRRSHTPAEIFNAYRNAVGRGKRMMPPPPEAFSHIVTHKTVTVSSRIIYVLRRLWQTDGIRYEDLFEEKKDKSDLVATFLAVLELVKGKRVRVEGGNCSAVIKLINGGVKNWKSRNFREQ